MIKCLFLHTYIPTFNPILGRGGGQIYLSALYRLKSPESRHKVGVMGYQNSSWDICDLQKFSDQCRVPLTLFHGGGGGVNLP